MNFADRLIKKIDETSPICVWIDPVLEKIPDFIKREAVAQYWENIEAVEIAFMEFWFWIIDSMQWLAWIIKPQLAYFERYWSSWIRAFEEICAYANEKWIMVIADWKRNDIWATSEAYAEAFLWKADIFWKKEAILDIDALTVNPYLWSDWIIPFTDICKREEKWIFILVKTSNPSSWDFQDLAIWEEMLCEEVARRVSDWWMADLWENYFSSVWAVVWATYPEEARYLRSLMPNQIFLVPWYWAQGWTLDTVRACFNEHKKWAIINSSRWINYAYLIDDKYSDENFIDASRNAIEIMKKNLESI